MNGGVLYIEDEFFFANTISNKLKEHGFAVDTAKNGKEGLEALKAKPYRLVLLDLILPELGGFEVLQKMKEDDALKHIPVVILSNLSSENDKRKAKELGAEEFCVKINSTPNEILAMVRRFMGSEKE